MFAGHVVLSIRERGSIGDKALQTQASHAVAVADASGSALRTENVQATADTATNNDRIDRERGLTTDLRDSVVVSAPEGVHRVARARAFSERYSPRSAFAPTSVKRPCATRSSITSTSSLGDASVLRSTS